MGSPFILNRLLIIWENLVNIEVVLLQNQEIGLHLKNYSPRIYLNILKMVKSIEDAQEILQDVFIKVWENGS
jgi:DNA-directed RNA polymerase specialized sigma24 family protein